MKVTRFLASLLVLGAAATSAFAEGTVQINWDSCTGPINKAVTPGVVAQSAVSVINQTALASGHQVFILVGQPGGLRDAWRFDPDGCQGSTLITMDHLPPGTLSKACPAFQGTLQSLQIKDYSYDPVTGKARGVIADAYPSGQVSINPAQRYFLAGWKFDQTFGVNGPSDPGQTCGGLEFPTCIHITKASYITFADGVEHDWIIGGEYITANDAANSSNCPAATPAASTTWGKLKSTYHN
jgi:hypothetical protein